MGASLSSKLDFSSLFHYRSRSDDKHNDRRTDDVLFTTYSDHIPINDNDVHFSRTHFIGEFVPERYLVLLTEQMTELLFRLMVCDEASFIMSDNTFDHQPTLRISIDDNNAPTPIVRPSTNSISDRSSFQWQSVHRSTIKSNMKMLTVEEFRKRRNKFHQMNNIRNSFDTEDEF